MFGLKCRSSVTMTDFLEICFYWEILKRILAIENVGVGKKKRNPQFFNKRGTSFIDEQCGIEKSWFHSSKSPQKYNSWFIQKNFMFR